MTKPRKKLTTKYHAFLVQPEPGFQPTNWQQTPEHYRILEYMGPKTFRGRADAWRFLHNHEAIENHDSQQEPIETWAIYLDFDSPIFGDQPRPSIPISAMTAAASVSAASTL